MPRDFVSQLILSGNARGGVSALRSFQGELGRSERRGKTFSTRLRDITRQTGFLQNALAGIAGALTVGAAFRQFSEFAAEGDQIGKTAANIGIAAESLQELRGAGELAGVEVNQVDDALRRFNRRLGLFVADGSGPAAKALDRLGLQVLDTRGSFRGTEEVLNDTIDAIAALPTVAEQAAAASELFGDDAGPKLVTLLSQGSAGVAELRQQIRDTGSVMSDEAVDAAEKYADQITLLQRQFVGIRNEIGSRVLPVVLDAVSAFNDLGRESSETEQEADDFAESVDNLADRIDPVVVGLARFAAGLISVGKFASAAVQSVDVMTSQFAEIGGFGVGTDQIAQGNFLDGLFGEGASEFLAGDGFNNAVLEDGALSALGQLAGTLSGLRKSTEEEAARFQEASTDFADIWAEAMDEVLETFQKADELTADFADRIRSRGKSWLDVVMEMADQARDVAKRSNEERERTVKGIKTLEEQLDALRRQLDGPVERVMRAHADRVEDAREAYVAGAGTLDEYTEAVQLSAEILDRELIAQLEDTQQTMLEMAQRALPPLIQQMLGLAEGTDRAAERFAVFQQAGQRLSGNITQSILNGQDLGESIGSSLLAFGQEPITQAVSEAFGNAFEGLADSPALQRGLQVGAFAVGQAMEGQFGSAVGSTLGGIVGSFLPGIGTLLGSAIGGALGSLFDGGSVPKFQIRGRNATRAIDEGTDRTVSTALGETQFAFREIDGEAQRSIIDAFSSFDESIAGVIRDAGQLEAVEAALDRFGVSSRSDSEDIQTLLKLRLDAILSTFDGFTREFVQQAESLEDQFARFASVFAIQRQLILGRGFGLGGLPADGGGLGPVGGGGSGGGGFRGGAGDDGVNPVNPEKIGQLDEFNKVLKGTGDAASITNPELQATLLLLDDLRLGTEPLAETFERLSGVVGTLDRVASLANATLSDTREGVVRLGADLASFFGDDAGAVADRFARIEEAFFSDDERFRATSEAAQQRGSDLLQQLLAGIDGVDFSEEFLTRSGFRQLFDELLASGELTGQQLAVLSEAGVAIADLVDAETSLAEARRRSQEEIGSTLLRLEGFTGGSLAEINETFDEAEARIRELDGSEGALLSVRFLHQQAIERYQASLESSIASLSQQLFGSGSIANAAQQATTAVTGLGNAFQDMSGVADSLRATIRSIQGNAATSNLDATGRRDFLQAQFDSAIAAGDFQTANSIAGQLAQAIRAVGASSADADSRISDLLGDLEAAASRADSMAPPTGAQIDQIGATVQRVEDASFENARLAQQLVTQIGELSGIIPQTGLEIAERFAVPIDELVGLLGVDLANLQADQVATIGQLAEDFDVTIAQLSEEIGISLGALEDATSLLNDGLERAINGLPPEIAGPLLDALRIVEETGDVSLLENRVNALPPALRNELAPFFDEIDVTGLQEVANGSLATIAEQALEQTELLRTMAGQDGSGRGGAKPDVIPPSKSSGPTPVTIMPNVLEVAGVHQMVRSLDAINAKLDSMATRQDLRGLLNATESVRSALAEGFRRQTDSFESMARALRVKGPVQ